ncbi:MAG: hypothetical protein ABL893_03980, partial [Hyphomicrobium sp.]
GQRLFACRGNGPREQNTSRHARLAQVWVPSIGFYLCIEVEDAIEIAGTSQAPTQYLHLRT